MSVSVVIPTYHSVHHLDHCLPPLLNSPLSPKVLIIDSSSNDGTVEKAKGYNVEIQVIPQCEFNHGTTRERGRQMMKTDIVVMMTPDAYALDANMLEKLVAPIEEEKIAISYARQIPHDGADIFESFPREFNYPTESHIRSLKDSDVYGPFTYFCSNSCAAYLNEALDEIGGFEHTSFGEDTIATARLLRKGYQIAYVADAIVKHTHRYKLMEEFHRHFDIGMMRQQYAHLLLNGTSDNKRGTTYATSLLKTVAKKCPHLIPYACLNIISKWFGYKIGQNSLHAPQWFKRSLSSQPYYYN